MKDKQIGKTVFKYVFKSTSTWGQWQHPGTGARFTEADMDEMNAVDVEPPVVLEPFEIRRLSLADSGTAAVSSVEGIEINVCYRISAQIVDGEAVLVAEKVTP